MTTKQIGEIIAQARLDKGISQSALAEQLEIRRQSLIEIENCQSNYSIDRLIDVLNSLDLEITITEKRSESYSFRGVRSLQRSDYEVNRKSIGKVKK